MPTRLAMLLAVVASLTVGGCGSGSTRQRIPAADVQQIDIEAGTFTGENAHPGTMVCGYRHRDRGWRCGPCRDGNHPKSACPSRQPLTLTVTNPGKVRRIVSLLNRLKVEGPPTTNCELPSATEGLLRVTLRSRQGGTTALVTFTDPYPPGGRSDSDVPVDCEPLFLNVGAAKQVDLISGDFSQTLGHLLDKRLP